jgi:hypothetical protein
MILYLYIIYILDRRDVGLDKKSDHTKYLLGRSLDLGGKGGMEPMPLDDAIIPMAQP